MILIHLKDFEQIIMNHLSELAREQARHYYEAQRIHIPRFFEVYQGMEEELKKKVFAGMQACEKFVKRDKDTREEVRTWVNQLNRHIDNLNRHCQEEKTYGNNKIMQATIRRKHLQIALQSWRKQKSKDYSINQKKAINYGRFTRTIATLFRRKSEKMITANKQQETLIKTSKKTCGY